VKVRCSYYNQYMSLCPPNKTLELNLKNHIASTKHERNAVDADNDSSREASIRSRCCRRP
jgi:hypothetical protein